MALKEKLIEYLETNDMRFVDRGDKVSCACLSPEHDDNSPSAFVKLDEGNEFFHCSSCKASMNTKQLYEFFEEGYNEDLVFKAQMNRMLKGETKVDKEEVKIYLPLKEGDFKKSYRGISPETFEKVGAYFTDPDAYYGKRIIFKLIDVEDRVRGFEAVSTNKKIIPKVLRPKGLHTDDFFGFEDLIQSDTVFINEGLFSALSWIEIGYDGVFNMGVASIKGKIKGLLKKGVKNVVLCADKDETGKLFNIDSYHLLKKTFNTCFFSFPYGSPNKFDTNDLLKQMGSEKFKEYVDKMLLKNMIKIKDKK